MSFSSKFYIKVILITLILLVFSLGLHHLQAQNKQNLTRKFNPKKDSIIKPQRKDLRQDLILAGSVDAENKADLRFQTSGQLAWVGVRVGDRVKKWQSIASLNKEEIRKNLQTQFNNYQTSLHNFNDTQDKYQETKEKYLLTDEIRRILDRSQFSLNNAVIQYELNDLAIKYATIVSPLSGVVTNIDQAVPSTNITPASTSFSIVDPESLFFKSEIDQEDVIKVKLGQKTLIRLDSFPQNSIDSKITYIAFTPVAGQSSTVYQIRFALPLKNNDLTYRLGMNGDALIVLSEKANVLSLPNEAISEDNGQKTVYVKDNKQVKKVNITTGIETETDTEILSGLNETDQVIISQK